MKPADLDRTHPRRIGWVGTAALALGGSNQSLFILGAILLTQGTGAVPLLAVGLLLSWAALPGWLELVMMWPNRVGGIAATCAEAFRPYSPVLANLTGVCYWWGWVPTCGLTAILSATAIHEWYLPALPIKLLAAAIVVTFTMVNLCGIRWVTRLAVTIGAASAGLAFLSGVIPMLSGRVDWHRAMSFHLTLPFHGAFGALTSAMAGLYLIGFAAPAFEAATCHVGETIDFRRNVPRAVFASAGMACLYFVLLPVVWLGVLGPHAMAGDLTAVLGPTFAPLIGGAAKAAAIWFMVTNMFHGSLQPLAGAARTLSQLSEDGLLPRVLAARNRYDAPWVATGVTGGMSIAFLVSGDPPSIIAAANLTYLIGIGLPSVAVWLLRRHAPQMERPWRAPRGTIGLGVFAAGVWGLSAIFGFEQFGLRYVLLGLGLAYSGSLAYSWRRWRDRRAAGAPRQVKRSLHFKLTGAMVAVMVLDGTGYLLAVTHVDKGQQLLVTALEDIFVAVALLTIAVGLVLPGMIAHAASQVSQAAQRLASGTLSELTRAMQALGAGDLQAARATPATLPVDVRTRDEVALMAGHFNDMQDEVARAARSLDGARAELEASRERLQRLADHDPLTGLFNRRRFELEVERALLRQPGRGGALILFDLDNFKLVNDSRGHAIGDAVLQTVAETVRARVRSSDVVARLGGDEFAVLLPDTEPRTALGVAQSLTEAIAGATSLTDRGGLVRITASAGLAVIDQTVLSAGQLLVDVDVALYAAKDAGRNQVVLAGTDVPMSAAGTARHGWLQTLRDALDNDRFELLAQPILDLRTGEVDRYELLLRYRDPAGELVAPGAFLSVAERYNLISEIDQWVVRRAFTIARAYSKAGRRSFEINLSGPSVTNPLMLELIQHELTHGGVPAETIIFEITETAAIANMAQAQAFAQRLKELGCRFALDDFGAGFGSFHYLRNLPFDYLKIDGEFVREIVHSERDHHVVKAIVGVATGLGLDTIAEFVEDEPTLCALRELGVRFAQGHHVGVPAPVPTLGGRVAVPHPRHPHAADQYAAASSLNSAGEVA
jgi:diguanylate cyclase (GGDEF)-like protein